MFLWCDLKLYLFKHMNEVCHFDCMSVGNPELCFVLPDYSVAFAPSE